VRPAALTAILACVALLSAAASASALSISVSGNHFVNGEGKTIRLLGVDRPSTEYACADGYAYASGGENTAEPLDPLDEADVEAIAAWKVDAVRIPLNEGCWLGHGGEPVDEKEPLTAAGYRAAIASYVSDLNAHGIYAILDLHWTAPGEEGANGQRSMPDANSLEFWTSVAGEFKNNHAVLFDAFNEPHGSTTFPVTWSCWLEGGCEVPDELEPAQADSPTYQAVGMQQLVDTIRATGADQPILLGGLEWANELGEWLNFEPEDPDHQLVASFHNYQGEVCETEACWNDTIAPLAESVPVVTGEFAEEGCPASSLGPETFDNRFMRWADEHGVSYLAWGWIVPEHLECGAEYALISSWSGTPLAPNGVALKAHLEALAAGPPPATAAPRAAGRPRVTGRAIPGHTVRCVSHWVALPAPTLSYRWLRDGRTLRGATRSTYRIPRSAHRWRLQCAVTARNSAGRATATSAAVRT